MLRFLIVPVVTAVLSAGSALAAPVTFDWAHVGNAGNAPDLQTDLSVGAVAYDYAISKTEVTNAQYVEFLNAVDPTGANSLELFSVNMTSKFGGITNDGLDDGFHYVARAGREHHPVAFVSWYDAIRFVNWLHNGQGNGDTDTGAYTLLGGTPVPSNRFGVTRNPGARFWLPSEDEWYKAAFHDATAGTAGVYFDFATGSNAIPVSDQASDNPAAVNYFNVDGISNGFNDGYAASGTQTLIDYPLTEVGAYSAAASPYGTFDQNGNVSEWIEDRVLRSYIVRGGSFGDHWFDLRSVDRMLRSPVLESYTGFRIAHIPEPRTLRLGALSALMMLAARRVRPFFAASTPTTSGEFQNQLAPPGSYPKFGANHRSTSSSVIPLRTA